MKSRVSKKIRYSMIVAIAGAIAIIGGWQAFAGPTDPNGLVYVSDNGDIPAGQNETVVQFTVVSTLPFQYIRFRPSDGVQVVGTSTEVGLSTLKMPTGVGMPDQVRDALLGLPVVGDIVEDGLAIPSALGAALKGGFANAPADTVRNQVVFTGGQGRPGVPYVFGVRVRGVARDGSAPTADTNIPWSVFISNSAIGATGNPLYTSPVNAPPYLNSIPASTTIRPLVLEGNMTVVGPAGVATDMIGTAGQDVTVRFTVTNYSSVSQTINTAWDIDTENGSVPNPPSGVIIPALSSKQIDAVIRLGTVAATKDLTGPTYTVSVTSTNGASKGVPTLSVGPFGIQTPAVIACGKITPQSTSLNPPADFTVEATKTGEVSVNVSNLRIRIGTTPTYFSLTLGQNADPGDDNIASGDWTGATGANPALAWIFPKSGSISPPPPQGSYPTVLDFSAVMDQNGAAIANITCPEILVDRTAPTFNIQAFTPFLWARSAGANQPAIKDRDSLSFVGTLDDNAPCDGAAKVTSGRIRQWNPAGQQIAGANMEIDPTTLFPATPAGPNQCAVSGPEVTNTPDEGGFKVTRLDGTVGNPIYHPQAASIDIQIEGHDVAGNTAVGVTPRLPVDNVAPFLKPETSAANKIKVFFNECLMGESRIPEWSVTEGSRVHTVTAIAELPCHIAGSHEYLTVGGVELTLRESFMNFNATPLVTFRRLVPDAWPQVCAPPPLPPTFCVGQGIPMDPKYPFFATNQDSTYWDSAQAVFAVPTSAVAVDKLASPPPVLASVTPGNRGSNGEFYSGGGADKRPTFHVSDTLVGDQICVVIYVPGQPYTVLKCSNFTSSSPSPFPLKSDIAFTVEKRHQIVLLAYDPRGNMSQSPPIGLNIDLTGPKLRQTPPAQMRPEGAALPVTGLAADARIEVHFDGEIFRGDDIAGDWNTKSSTGKALDATVTAVGACQIPSASCRLLDVSGSEWGKVRFIEYLPQDPNRAYQDLAGNTAGDVPGQNIAPVQCVGAACPPGGSSSKRAEGSDTKAATPGVSPANLPVSIRGRLAQ